MASSGGRHFAANFLAGEGGKALSRDLDSINHNDNEMFPVEVLPMLKAQSNAMSVPLQFMTGTTTPGFASVMPTALVEVTKNHFQPVVLWNMNLGLQGVAKTACLSLIEEALLSIEADDMEKLKKYLMENPAEGTNDDQTPSKKRKTFDRRAVQMVVQNSTIQGLENILMVKSEKSNIKATSILMSYDEATLLFSNQKQNNDYETKFLTMYNGSPLRSNTKTGGLVDLAKPRISVSAFTQPATLLKAMIELEDDSGGKMNRFTFTAPERVYKNMAKERATNLEEFPKIKELLEICKTMHSGEEDVYYKFDDEAEKAIDAYVDRGNKEIQADPNNSFLSGQVGKSLSKVVRISGCYAAIRGSFAIHLERKRKEENEEEEMTHVEEKELFKPFQTISVSVLNMAIKTVDYSNEVHKTLMKYLRNEVTVDGSGRKKGTTAIYSNYPDTEMEDEQVLKFSEIITKLFKSEEITNGNQITTDKVRVKDLFPQGDQSAKNKYSKKHRSMYWLEVLERKGLLQIDNKKVWVDLMTEEDQRDDNHFVEKLKKKDLNFSMPIKSLVRKD